MAYTTALVMPSGLKNVIAACVHLTKSSLPFQVVFANVLKPNPKTLASLQQKRDGTFLYVAMAVQNHNMPYCLLLISIVKPAFNILTAS